MIRFDVWSAGNENVLMLALSHFDANIKSLIMSATTILAGRSISRRRRHSEVRLDRCYMGDVFALFPVLQIEVQHRASVRLAPSY